MKTRAL